MPDGNKPILVPPFFAKNDVIVSESASYRVIQVTPQQVFIFQLGLERGFPVPVEHMLLESQYMSGEFRIQDNHEYSAPATVLSARNNARDEATKRYQIIKPIVEAEDYLVSSERGKLIAQQIKNTGYSKASIYRLLRLYWSRGQCLQALATDYDNCGARGKSRTLISKKPGKKNRKETDRKAIRTDEHLTLMYRVIDVFYFAKKKDLKYVYRRFVTLCLDSKLNKDIDTIPKLESLRNVLKSHYSIEQYSKGIHDVRVYEKDIRTLKSTAAAPLFGPGERYEIDATLLKVHVVSNNDPSKVIGKPTLYLMVDVFSQLITGFYIGLHSPSYKTATITLLSANQDKTHLLRKHNIDKEVCSSWPAAGLPTALMSDKAELFGLQGSHLVETTGIRIENTASGKSEAKGTVEGSLGLVQRLFTGETPGKSNDVKNKKAGAVDGRLTATLTLDEVEEAIISEIVLLNNCRPLTRYDRSKDMPDDMVLTPANVWNWGMINRTGKIVKVDEDSLKIAVLPQAEATVSRDGVRFHNLYYSSPELENLGWFLRVKDNRVRPSKIKVLFDPLIVNYIYLLLPKVKRGLVVCHLKDRSRAFQDCSFLEVDRRVSIQKQAVSTANYDEQKRKNEEKWLLTMKNAEKRKRNQTFRASAAQTKREIPANKSQAKLAEQKKLIDDYSPTQIKIVDESKKSLIEPSDDFSDPDMDALFNLNQEKDIKHEADGTDDEH